MRKTTCLGLVLVGLVFCGCSTDMRYARYTGAQPWFDQSSGTMADTSYNLPVYRGWPEKPYVVLGNVRHKKGKEYWKDSRIEDAVAEAKRHGGEALIIRQGAEFGVSKIFGMDSDPHVVANAQLTALVIRWKTEEEIAQEKAAQQDFLKAFETKYPNLSYNMEVTEIVMRFFLFTGRDLTSDDSKRQCAEIMEKANKKSPNDLTGTWAFKGTVTRSRLGSSDPYPVLGIVNASQRGDDLTIVSDRGNAEINFTGKCINGRVTGQLGISGVSVKCEGAALPDKISISFESLVASGTVNGNIIFQR